MEHGPALGPTTASSPRVFPGAEGEHKTTESFLQVPHTPGTQGEGRKPDFGQVAIANLQAVATHLCHCQVVEFSWW